MTDVEAGTGAAETKREETMAPVEEDEVVAMAEVATRMW